MARSPSAAAAAATSAASASSGSATAHAPADFSAARSALASTRAMSGTGPVKIARRAALLRRHRRQQRRRQQQRRRARVARHLGKVLEVERLDRALVDDVDDQRCFCFRAREGRRERGERGGGEEERGHVGFARGTLASQPLRNHGARGRSRCRSARHASQQLWRRPASVLGHQLSLTGRYGGGDATPMRPPMATPALQMTHPALRARPAKAQPSRLSCRVRRGRRRWCRRPGAGWRGMRYQPGAPRNAPPVPPPASRTTNRSPPVFPRSASPIAQPQFTRPAKGSPRMPGMTAADVIHHHGKVYTPRASARPTPPRRR